ncbi:MAG TPA: invasion associated locus B family protein [Devosia sp.]|nr:invasion associated locus B family protein [Devosia sp.]
MHKRAAHWGFAVLFATLGALPAAAQSVRLIGEYRDWSAYSATEGAGALCFAMSLPKEVTPTPEGFTQAYLYLTNRPSEGVASEFNLVAGFPFQAGAPATVTVGGQVFQLFTESDSAWLLDPATSSGLASAIRAGSTLTVDGVSAAGVAVTQIFSLSGATAAQRAIEGGC